MTDAEEGGKMKARERVASWLDNEAPEMPHDRQARMVLVMSIGGLVIENEVLQAELAALRKRVVEALEPFARVADDTTLKYHIGVEPDWAIGIMFGRDAASPLSQTQVRAADYGRAAALHAELKGGEGG